jgi:hypothetical protein
VRDTRRIAVDLGEIRQHHLEDARVDARGCVIVKINWFLSHESAQE